MADRNAIFRRGAIKAGALTLLLSQSHSTVANTNSSIVGSINQPTESSSDSFDASSDETAVKQNGILKADHSWRSGRSSSEYNHSVRIGDGYPILNRKFGAVGDRELQGLSIPYTIHTTFKLSSDTSTGNIALFLSDYRPEAYVGVGFANSTKIQIEKYNYEEENININKTDYDFNDGRWHELYIIFDNNFIKIYDNGEKIRDFAYSGWETQTTPYWGVGASTSNNVKNSIIESFSIYQDSVRPNESGSASSTAVKFPFEFGKKHPRPKEFNPNIDDKER